MRISDWSSDVCSSDLGRKLRGAHGLVEVALGIAAGHVLDQPGDFRFEQHELARERFHRNPAELFGHEARSEEHTSELQSLMRISYAVFCLKKKNNITNTSTTQLDTYIYIH